MPDPRPNDTKQLFKECGTCSETFAHITDREFGHPMKLHERALTKLAGGIVNKGHQCGMLWGASLSVGAEAGRREADPDQAIGLALAATRPLVASFQKRNHTVNCRDITGKNLDSFFGLVSFIFTTFRRGMDNSPCFVLAEEWTPEALSAAREGLEDAPPMEGTPRSCASEMVRALGGTEEEAVMVAGFGGGLGLDGEGCGALGAAIWLKSLRWCEDNPDKTVGLFQDVGDKPILRVFEEHTGGEYRCKKICGRTFDSVEEHSQFIETGGCKTLIEAMAAS